jgi:hypothetical protein
MSKRSPSVPLDISIDELKETFAKHPVLKRIPENKLETFKSFLNSVYEKAVKQNLDVSNPVTNATAKLDKPVLTQEEWDQWRNTNILDDMAFYRFLYQHLFETRTVPHCEFLILDMLKWRKEFKPDHIKLKDVESVAKSGFLYHSGHDKKNRPILNLIICKDKTDFSAENVDKKFKTMVYEYERCIAAMENCEPEVYQICWVVQVYESTISVDLVTTMKASFDELENRYPERTGQILVLNPPVTVSIVWPVIKAFLTEDQANRYVFISGWYDSDIRNGLLEKIDDDQLTSELYEGKNPYVYDFEKRAAEDK